MTKHPAKYSNEIISKILSEVQLRLDTGSIILDPFAGIGGVHILYPKYNTIGIEIEEEWALQHPKNICFDSTKLNELIHAESVDAIVTSPAYGNRMSDQYKGDSKNSKRYTYRLSLGRELSENNGAKFNWSKKYRELHSKVWQECYLILKSGGYIFLNSSNHIRSGEQILVNEWHLSELLSLGFKIDEILSIKTKRMKHGSNADLRVDSEKLMILRKC
jgi:tRNA G10  N-methylase Trm11